MHTMPIWKDTVKKVLHLEPEHVSFYSLQLEEGTPFWELYRDGTLDLVSDALDRQMYHFAMKAFEKSGYAQYEISNCAKQGYACRHNLKYWSLGEYLGIGLGAHSYLRDRDDNVGCRHHNLEGLTEYFSVIQQEQWPIDMRSYHVDTDKDAMAIFAFTSLRKREGIPLDDFQQRFHRNFFEAYKDKAETIFRYKKEGLLEYDGSRIWLTERGIDVSNDIMSEFV